MPSQRIQIALSFICVAALLMVSSGCSTLPLASTAGAIATGAPDDVRQFQVKMETFGGAKMYTGTIDGPLTIQTALERSGAIKKYRDMEVDLFRKIDGAYQPLKMTASYDAAKRRIQPETDYGLRAGDSILVKAKTQNPLSNVMGSFTQ